MMTGEQLTAKYGAGYAPSTVRERDAYWRDAYGVSYDEMMCEDFTPEVEREDDHEEEVDDE